MANNRTLFWKLLLSAGVSLITLGLIFHLLTGDSMGATRARLMTLLVSVSLTGVAAYIFCQLAQTLFRAMRYNVLLAGCGESNTPGIGRMYLATLGRNMLVDMLPARAGELSYIALVNRGYRVSLENSTSSMTVSMLFDFIALFVLALFVLLIPAAAAVGRGFLLVSLLASGLAGTAGILVIYVGIPWAARFLRKWVGPPQAAGLRERIVNFLEGLGDSIRRTARIRTLVFALGLSLLVRAFKYGGLYAAFLAVTRSTLPQLAEAPFAGVILAFLAAEGAAALPIPSFMSFGTYEAGGLAAFTFLGFPLEQASIAILAVHVVSQMVDYSLGGIGLALFSFSTRPVAGPSIEPTIKRSNGAWALAAVVLALFGAAFFAYEQRNVKKLGSAKPPDRGVAVAVAPEQEDQYKSWLGNDRGFIIWSSNRDGNHNLYRMTLPDRRIEALTSHPHVEYYARISPDGKKVAFSRSQVPWVSQRDPLPWDVYVLDLESGKESLIATNGNTPSWTSDGRGIIYQRNAGQVVLYDFESKTEQVLLKCGTDRIPASVQFQTPEYNEQDRKLALTLRGKTRATGIYELDKSVFDKTGGGCMLSWARDLSFLYYVDGPGRMKNAIYRFTPDSERRLWLDLPEPYSHEYFPRMSNDGRYLVLGASAGGHEHDSADYEIFLWRIGEPPESAQRLTFHTGNDCWPDVFIE